MAASITRACLAFGLCLAAAYLGGGGLWQLAMVTLTYFITATVFAPAIWRGPLARFDMSDLRSFARFGVPITISVAPVMRFRSASNAASVTMKSVAP